MTKTSKNTNNNNNDRSNIRDLSKLAKDLNQMMHPKQKKGKPFRKVGGTIGGIFGPVGKNLGKMAGSAIGSIFGSGDYYMPLPNPTVNSIISTQPPKFVSPRNNGNHTVVKKVEYVQDIVVAAGGGFNNQQLFINPGNAILFPFLNTIAQGYEQYKIHGMIFEFRSLSADSLNSVNTGLGSVILSTQYDALDPVFTSKLQMENYDLSQSAKPSITQRHGIECKRSEGVLGELYVLNGAAPSGSDLRLYDFGTFNIATVGLPNTSTQTIGELYVTYEIELLKPKLPNSIGGIVPSYHYAASSTSAGTTPLAPTTVSVSTGTLIGFVVSGSSIGFTGLTNNVYAIQIMWQSGGAVTFAIPAVTYSTNCAASGITAISTTPGFPQNGLAADTFGTMTVYARCTSSGFMNITLGTAGTVPTNAALTIIVSAIDSSISQ